ncbi:hypothetical protein [Bradyrhizobium sp. USDA 4529]
MNICECPKPPGGKATCPDDHVAICRVIKGVAETACIPPDKTLSKEDQAIEFLRIITGQLFTTLGHAEQSILDAGEYVSPDGSMRVLFSLPESGRSGGGAGARVA